MGISEILSGVYAIAMTCSTLNLASSYDLMAQGLLVVGTLLLSTVRKKRSFLPYLNTKHTVIPCAVVGVVDIVSSTQISNSLDLYTNFTFKRSFLKAASQRAKESNIMILNDTGDGFLFLANDENSSNWCMNLASFYENLTSDFQDILRHTNDLTGQQLQSGLRFGVSCGPVILGGLGDKSSQITAVGSIVNLAARLCSRADVNEIVFSARVWETLRTVLPDWKVEKRIYGDLKGFNSDVSVLHANRRAITLQLGTAA